MYFKLGYVFYKLIMICPLTFYCYPLKQDRVDFNTFTLKLWRHKESIYPSLHKIAFTYLIAQATLVASEWICSTSGNILSTNRNRLSDDNVDKLIFLTKNKCISS